MVECLGVGLQCDAKIAAEVGLLPAFLPADPTRWGSRWRTGAVIVVNFCCHVWLSMTQISVSYSDVMVLYDSLPPEGLLSFAADWFFSDRKFMIKNVFALKYDAW